MSATKITNLLNSIEANIRILNEHHSWSEDGDEWKGQAEACGVAYDDWKASVVERLITPYVRRNMTIVEIAPGHGRWTEFLRPHAKTLMLVDISPACLSHCRTRFEGDTNLETYQTDGRSLPIELEDGVDLVWSFDSFVHIDPADIRGYLQEIRRVLKPGGTAVLHHAGRRHAALPLAGLRRLGRLGKLAYRVASMGFDEKSDGWRSDVSARLVREMAERAGLRVLEQFTRWGDVKAFGVPRFRDSISVLRRPSIEVRPAAQAPSRASGPVRQCRLPDFLCIGAQKAGTSTLHVMLMAHPQVFVPRRKELHYFTLHSGRSIDWYSSFYHDARDLQESGEVTPYYLFHPAAAARIRRLLPHVRLILLLRDPVERALSGYFHSVRRGEEKLDIESAFEREETRLEGAEERLMQVGARHLAHQLYSYTSRSRYDRQISVYRSLFPSDRMLLVRSEDLVGNTAQTWPAIQRFLGVDPSPWEGELPRRNQGRYSAAAVPAALRERLRTQLDPTYRAMDVEYGIKWNAS